MRINNYVLAIALGMAIGAGVRLAIAGGDDSLFWNPYWIPLLSN